jgi:hypothetical protein
MKKIFIAIFISIMPLMHMEAQTKVVGVKWEESYSFDKCNTFRIDFYSKNNELMRTADCVTYFQSKGKDFATFIDYHGKGNNMITVFDLKNEVTIQVIGKDVPNPMYNAGKFKYPSPEETKRLELKPVEEVRIIAGYKCQRYDYTYKKIFGSVWITQDVTLPNDYGIFRAAKMTALHNTLSVDGFVIEMTTEDSKGGKTVMTTLSIGQDANYTVNFKNVDMGVAINTLSYYAF